MTVPIDKTTLQKLRAIRPYFAGTGWAFFWSAVGAAVSAACEGGTSWFFKLLLDNGFGNGSKGGHALWMFPVAIIALFTVRGIAGFVINYTLAWAANQATLRLRNDMFSRVLDAHPQLFARSASSLINTVVYEVLGGVAMLVNSVQTVVKDACTAIGLLGIMLFYNWQLTLILAVLVPPVGYAMRVFGKRMRRITRESQQATDDLAYVVEENVLAWRIVRLHGAEGMQHGRFERSSRSLRKLMLKATVAASTITPVTQLITACAMAAVITAALWQNQSSGMTVGDFGGFLMAAIGVASPLRRLTDVAGPVSRGLTSIERGLELIDGMPVETSGTHAVDRAKGDIRLLDVSKQYGEIEGEATALVDVSLDIRAGETVALVGPSGAGKSTLVNLLPRFLDPTSGTVALDGVPLAEWQLKSLRDQFALVSQDVVLFNDTIAANVSLGDVLDRGRVMAALTAANLHDFVATLPLGLDAPVGHNGAQLSGGQRQRLAIARAIYKDAPVLILDEATSALDSESERLVQQALERLMQGRTSIVIAHRLSTIERASRIVVLQAGKVVEQGSHAELLTNGGLYSRLHALQFSTT